MAEGGSTDLGAVSEGYRLKIEGWNFQPSTFNVSFLLFRRARSYNTKRTAGTRIAAMRIAAAMGAKRASSVAPPARKSSTKLTSGLPIPAVVTVITGRDVALTA